MTWLILDVDGVLLDAMRGGRGSWKYEFSSRFNVDADELREAFFEPYWDDIIVGKRDIVPALSAALHSLRWDIDVEDALVCWFEADFVPNDDVVRKVNDLERRGVTLAVATNQEHLRAAFLKERVAALLPVSGFVYSAEVGFVKSDPRFFAAAQQQLDLPPDMSRVVFVDDSVANVRSAQEAHWHAVNFGPSFDWREHVEAFLLPHEFRD
jgi:putative hydrolase of the HAD superfamily